MISVIAVLIAQTGPDCEDYCTDHETQEVEDPKN